MTISTEKTKRVIEFIKEGVSYRNIVKQLNISLSQVQKIAKGMKEVERESIVDNRAKGVEAIKEQIIEIQEDRINELNFVVQENKSLNQFIEELGKKAISSLQNNYDDLTRKEQIEFVEQIIEYSIRNKQVNASVFIAKTKELDG